MKYTNTNTNPTIECAYKEVVIIGESIKCSYVDIYIYFTLAISLMRIHEQTHRKKQKTNKKNSSKFSKNGHRHNVNAMKRLNVKALIVKYIKNFCLEFGVRLPTDLVGVCIDFVCDFHCHIPLSNRLRRLHAMDGNIQWHTQLIHTKSEEKKVTFKHRLPK